MAFGHTVSTQIRKFMHLIHSRNIQVNGYYSLKKTMILSDFFLLADNIFIYVSYEELSSTSKTLALRVLQRASF